MLGTCGLDTGVLTDYVNSCRHEKFRPTAWNLWTRQLSFDGLSELLHHEIRLRSTSGPGIDYVNPCKHSVLTEVDCLGLVDSVLVFWWITRSKTRTKTASTKSRPKPAGQSFWAGGGTFDLML